MAILESDLECADCGVSEGLTDLLGDYFCGDCYPQAFCSITEAALDEDEEEMGDGS